MSTIHSKNPSFLRETKLGATKTPTKCKIAPSLKLHNYKCTNKVTGNIKGMQGGEDLDVHTNGNNMKTMHGNVCGRLF
jgi:hypothetical protein